MIKILATFAGVAACLAASVTTALWRGQAPIEASAVTVPVESAATVESFATVEPADAWLSVVVPTGEVVVTAPSSARLAAVEVSMGDVVVAGRVVAVLDPRTLRH